jgi:hypothetical protein
MLSAPHLAASFAALLSTGLAAPPDAASGAAPVAGLSGVAERVAVGIGPPLEGRRTVALRVETRARALAAPLETALAEALARQGYAVTPLRGEGDAEAAARADGQDWLVRAQAGLVPGRPELALVAEVIPAWASFFLQRRPGARALPPRLVQARAPADPETLLLAREARPAGAPIAVVRLLARVPGRVLALAVGDTGDGPSIAAVTAAGELLLGPQGEVRARREPDRAGWRPIRDPGATVAIGDFGGGRLAVAHAGAPRGEVLTRRGDRLEVVAGLAAAPLCAGESGALFGQFAPGKGVLADQLSRFVDPDARPRSPRTLYAVAAAPRPGPVAFAALADDLRLELLGPSLGEVGPPLPGVGVGFALADLDGDGTAEIVASSPAAGEPDRIRVLLPRADAPPLLESGPIAGALLAGAAGDLTGDGLDDAVLAAVAVGPDGAPVSELYLVTADPRELQ